jgi:hypothetical protein
MTTLSCVGSPLATPCAKAPPAPAAAASNGDFTGALAHDAAPPASAAASAARLVIVDMEAPLRW